VAQRRNTGTNHTTRPEDTRMQRERMQDELEKAQAERAGQLTMISAKERADDNSGVWDPETGDLLESGITPEELETYRDDSLRGEDEVIEDARRPTPVMEALSNGVGPNGIPVRSAAERRSEDAIVDPEESRPPVATLTRRSPVVQDDRARMVIARINSDIDATVGAGNTYALKRGKRYRLPKHVADHLIEKGYVADH